MRRVYQYRVPVHRFSLHIRLYIRPNLNRGSLVGMVFHQGQRLRFSLGHYHIRPEHWDGIRERMMIGSPDCDTVNKSIDQWIAIIDDQLISKQQLQKRYGVCRETTRTWIRKYDLPVIEITQHRKYFRMSDVLKWEEGLMKGTSE